MTRFLHRVNYILAHTKINFWYLTCMKLTAFLMAVGLCMGQTPSGTPASTTKPAPEAAKPAPKPVLTEMENLKLQNLRLKRDLLQSQIATAQSELSKEVGEFVETTTKAHVGECVYKFNAQPFEFECAAVPVSAPAKK